MSTIGSRYIKRIKELEDKLAKAEAERNAFQTQAGGYKKQLFEAKAVHKLDLDAMKERIDEAEAKALELQCYIDRIEKKP